MRLCKNNDEILNNYWIWNMRTYLRISPLSDSDDFLLWSLRLSNLSKFCVRPENGYRRSKVHLTWSLQVFWKIIKKWVKHNRIPRRVFATILLGPLETVYILEFRTEIKKINLKIANELLRDQLDDSWLNLLPWSF